MHTEGSYRDVLKVPGVQPFLWLQFFNAFNDNMYKIVVSLLAVSAGGPSAERRLSGTGQLHFCSTVFDFCHLCGTTGRPF